MILGVLIAASASAQAVKDRPQVEKLCGCFDVEFKYAETFSPDPSYKYHDREEISGGTELVIPVEVSDKKIVLQHLLVITDSMIVKHWREDWTYENNEVFNYKGNKTWKKEKLKPEQAKGTWTQSVWEVSDEPRYQGTAQWQNVDGKTVWTNTTDAPLPRREYSVRSDYNILRRTNRISITKDGYLHEQDNQKIIRTGDTDKLLVSEKGINSYTRIDSSKCAPALFYWEKNKTYWTKVKTIWADYIAKNNTVELKTKVNGKVLHEYLYELASDYRTGKIKPENIDAAIKAEIEKFLGHDEKTTTVAQGK
jgi:hypothetical protein